MTTNEINIENLFKNRKEEIEKALKEHTQQVKILTKELVKVNQVLRALKGTPKRKKPKTKPAHAWQPDCEGYPACRGCYTCRQGPEFR